MPSDADGAQFEDTLLELAAQEASGRLLISGPDGNYGWVWLRDGFVSGASGPGSRPLLANRLITFGMLPRSRVAKLISETRSRPGARLFDILFERRAVPAEFLSDFVASATAEQLHHINSMGISMVVFENGRTQRAGPSVTLAHEVVAASHEQRTELWEIPMSTQFICPDATVEFDTPVAHAVSTRADGNRDTRQIADSCGLTLHETITNVEKLLAEGVITTSDSTDMQDAWQVATAYPATKNGRPPAPPPPRPDLREVAETETAVVHPDPSLTNTGSFQSIAELDPAAADEPQTPVTESRFPLPPDTNPPTSESAKRVGASSAADRRDLMSNLSALSTDDSADPPPQPPPPELDEQLVAEPPEPEPTSGYGKRQHTANPGAASEMFRELRSLAGEDESADAPGDSEAAASTTQDSEPSDNAKKRRLFGL